MAGGEGSLRRCTAKSVEAAAASGPQAPSLHRCSAKRKAKKEAPSGRSTGRKTKEAASAGAAAETEAATGPGTNRLSAKEIRWILAQETSAPPPRYQALKRINPELTPLPGEEADEDKVRLYFLAREFYRVEECFPKLQAWMRAEMKSKGYVEVDDGWDKRQAEAQAVIDREWPEIEAKLRALRLPAQDCEGDGECVHDSDDEEEEEEED